MSANLEEQQAQSWDRPEGASFSEWMESRSYDWNALKFQADFDPKYRRAQMRYVGTGGTGVASDKRSVPAEHFTFSTMIIPAGNEGPMHLHTDVEEIFLSCAEKSRSCAKRMARNGRPSSASAT